MKKEKERLSYLVLGLIASFIVFSACLAVFSSSVSAAVSISFVEGNGVTNVTISNPGLENLYSYEINFNLSGSYKITDRKYFGVGTSTFGNSTSGNVITVYSSYLGPSGVGVASRLAFTINYTGNLVPTTSLIVKANTDETNLCLVDAGCCGDGIIQSNKGEQCDNGALNGVNGNSCSSTCQTVVPVTSPVDNVTSPTNGGTGGTAGGGGGGSETVASNVVLSADVSQITESVVIGQSPSKSFKITNNGNSTVTFSLRVSGLPETILIAPSRLTLAPKETETVNVTFAGIKRGLFTGNVIADVDGRVVYEIPVTINVKTSNFIYDLSLGLQSKYRYILPGGNLTARIDFRKIGSVSGPSNVSVYYNIKDFSGTTVYEENEVLSMAGDRSYSKQLDTSKLPLGKYVIGIEVVYPGAYASSSARFDIVNKEPLNYKIISFVILVTFVLLVAFAIRLTRRNRELVYKKRSKL